MIRIANGQGFWGDSLEAPVELVRRGPIDYLTLDYLAEITMSILQKQRARDPKAGYARDFVDMIARVLPDLKQRRIRVIANAGGVNPKGCADAILEIARRQGVALKVAVVSGDDIMDRLDRLDLRNMETGEPFASIRGRVQSANVYLGAFPVVEALRQGADMVVTGRVTDTGLTLAPLIHEFGWKADEWDRLAAGTIAGHTIECGAQCTGGNCQMDWETIPDLYDIGYPIVEAEPDGTFVVTKHTGTGGRVTVASVKEQLLYEMGDPREYITPDCIADFTTIQLAPTGTDRVRFTGIKGRPATEFYKVSISYSAGYKAMGSMVYAWPDAYKKARAAEQILRRRLDRLGLRFDALRAEFLGANACHGIPAAEPPPEIAERLAEVVLRFGVRGQDRAAVDRFTREIPPLALNGPPVVSGLGTGRPRVEEIVAYWPALIHKREVQPEVTIWPSES
ncbi:MAG TPA: acyclic terpene utilization AtuA family protein [Bryobacteraceae bacterium]|jgi:hypothetical protein